MPSSTFCLHTRSIYSNISSILLSFFNLNPSCLSQLPHKKCLCWIHWLCFVWRQMFSFHFVEVWPLDSGLVWLHRSHYLKYFALKQKVRDQQILTSGQAYDSFLIQFSNSSSLTSHACPPIWYLIRLLQTHSHSFRFRQALARTKHSTGLFSNFFSPRFAFLLYLLAYTLWTQIVHLKNWPSFWFYKRNLLPTTCLSLSKNK